jgi:1-deoxy-D-xylulose-5-phosphate synthase
MHPNLAKITSARDLQGMSVSQLKTLAVEIRDVLCTLLESRSAHFASNLGVVELCLALHSSFDFLHDRLIWDTGHQVYPHKLVTGRYSDFLSIRTRSGLMGYPNPLESPYDLFMTGHAGSSISTMLGLHSGDDLAGDDDRHAVVVIGDGAFPSGIVSEAFNNSGASSDRLLVILNDNKMSICPRVGGLASYLDRLRTAPFYAGLKSEARKILNSVPLLGDPVERFLSQLKQAVKAGLHGGMMFEELGFRYLGPVDGHNIATLRKYMKMVKDTEGPTLLHVVTEKGHGYEPAAEDPVFYHTPPTLASTESSLPASASGSLNFTHYARDSILEMMRQDERVTVLTAAMCQGNKLEPVRDEFPERFFDVGICEGHAVAFAAGQAKAGLRPIVAIYSTFLQRSLDQIFQEVALQNLPVTFMLDRSGLAGPDGPTHHGVFDLGYLRIFPNLTLMAPADGEDLKRMLQFSIQHTGPCAVRYPKAGAPLISRQVADLELGQSEQLAAGSDGTIVSCGALLDQALAAREELAAEGMDVGVLNARFVKPLDRQALAGVLSDSPFVVTVEEAALAGGFGSAVLEIASEMQLAGNRLQCLGVPDRFIEHGDRQVLLGELGLDAAGIAESCRRVADLAQVAGREARPGSVEEMTS